MQNQSFDDSNMITIIVYLTSTSIKKRESLLTNSFNSISQILFAFCDFAQIRQVLPAISNTHHNNFSKFAHFWHFHRPVDENVQETIRLYGWYLQRKGWQKSRDESNYKRSCLAAQSCNICYWRCSRTKTTKTKRDNQGKNRTITQQKSHSHSEPSIKSTRIASTA